MSWIRRVTLAEVERLPWKNGRGETAQIALWPPSASFARGDFDWRVSRAVVAEAGPFSAFPGFDRVLVIVGGEGLDLRHGGAAPPARVAAFEPYGFSGDWPTTATLACGAVSDFNVLARRDRASARVRTVRSAPSRERLVLSGSHALVHVIDGCAEATVAGSASPIVLDAFDTLWLGELDAPVQMTLAAPASATSVVIVEILPGAGTS